MGEIKVKVNLDEVKEEISSLEKQIIELSNTVDKLNEYGVGIKLKMKLDGNKIKGNIFY